MQNKNEQKKNYSSTLNAKKAKTAQVSKIATSLGHDIANDSAELYAAALISPKDVGPVIFPSVTPSRCGAAMFPLVVEVTVPTDFGIIVQPSLSEPLQITSPTALAETNDSIYGRVQLSGGDVSVLDTDQPCTVQKQSVDGKECLPISASASASISFNIKLLKALKSGSWTFDVYTHDSATGLWMSRASVATGSNDAVPAGPLGPFTITSTVDYYSFGYSNFNGANLMDYEYVITVVGNATCAPAGLGLLTYLPEWSTVLEASQRARVVAMDCLVTYEGSTLNNGGSIAVCNTDDDLAIRSSFYNTIASRPHDMYRGRLASEGETEGGAHWHYVPDSVDQLILQDRTSELSEVRQHPYGYFGIQGKTAAEVVRIEIHVMINFYSFDPSFVMSVQPPFTDFTALLYALRKEVSLVSSNDSHMQKLSKFLRSGAKKGLNLSKAGIAFSKNHEKDIGTALSILSTLV